MINTISMNLAKISSDISKVDKKIEKLDTESAETIKTVKAIDSIKAVEVTDRRDTMSSKYYAVKLNEWETKLYQRNLDIMA